ncbi:alpha/beta hydrolase [Paenibacillus sp. GCM10027628]|uniref:alpha/beta hydrolase n=1 Tax=Paenibacillus sp. GCM10027628 TaxID=3273413 RepID=UPI0036332A7E
MEAREGIFNGVGGVELFYRVIEPKSTPKGAVIALHGHGDHSGGLNNIFEKLSENNYLTYAFDLRGHGKSSGTRGYIRTWDEYIGDLHAFRELVASEVPQLPLYMMAHSLGGVISLDYSLYHGEGISGLVLIAPAISYELKPSEKLLIALMSKLKPNLTIKNSSNYQLLTQDLEIQNRLKSDLLRHNTVTPGLGRGLMQAVQRLESSAGSIKMPILLQYGLGDEVTPPVKLRQFFHSIGSQDKQNYEYEAMRHRPFDDLGRERFFADLLTWLDRH